MATQVGKVYVLRTRETKMYVTERKGKGQGLYLGLFIGTAGKRYGAVRFEGGPDLDAKLLLNGNRDLVAVEVKK